MYRVRSGAVRWLPCPSVAVDFQALYACWIRSATASKNRRLAPRRLDSNRGKRFRQLGQFKTAIYDRDVVESAARRGLDLQAVQGILTIRSLSYARSPLMLKFAEPERRTYPSTE
jgi:hypothetical protein